MRGFPWGLDPHMLGRRASCRWLTGPLVATLLWVPGSLARAQDPSLPDLARQVEEQNQRIDELQKSLQDQSDVIETLREPKADSQGTSSESASSVETLATPPSEATVPPRSPFLEALSTAARRTVNGRIHIDEWAFPNSSPGINTMENGDPGLDPENRLLYRRIRFGVRGDIPPHNMSYRAEIEFSGQDGSQFRDAWIGFDDLPLVNTVRVGNQKRPYGWDHLNSSNFMVFLERPFVVDGFNEDSRRFGIVAYDATDDERFNWQWGCYNLTPVQSIGSVIGDVRQLELAGRLGHTWWYADDGREYAHWGLAGTVAFPDGDAPNDGRHNNEARFRSRPEGRSSDQWLDTGPIAGADSYEILGIESVFNSGAFQVAGEYMNLWLQRSGPGEGVFLHGGYVYFSCFSHGRAHPVEPQPGDPRARGAAAQLHPVRFRERLQYAWLGRMAGRLAAVAGRLQQPGRPGRCRPERHSRAELVLELSRPDAVQLHLRARRRPADRAPERRRTGLGKLSDPGRPIRRRLLTASACGPTRQRGAC